MRREHIASPRSPPVRGLATDSGRRSGIQFYGGRSVQKGELEFKPMFNKKNISKLLVFAMLLTMLPVSTVAAGTETTPPTPVSKEVGAYVTVSDAYVTGRDATDVAYMTKADTTNGSYKFSADSSTVTPNENQKVTISFKADLGKKDNSRSNSKSEKAAGLKIKYSNKGYLVNRDTNTTPGAKNTGTSYYDESGQSGYTVNGDVYQVRCDITISNTAKAKSGSSKNEEATFMLIPIDAKGNELDEKTITLTIPLKEDSGDKNATYAVIKDSGVTVNGDESSIHKTLSLTKSTDSDSKGTTDDPYKFTSSDTNAYVVAEDSKVEVSFSTENAASVTYSIGSDANNWNGTATPAFKNSTYTITIDTSEMQPTATGKQEVNVYVKVNGGEKTGIESTYNVLTFNVWVGKPAEYTITVAAAQNGTVTTNPANKATANEEVTITASPSAGYEVDTITVTKENSNETVDVTDNKFTMPASNVTVTVTFKKAGGTTPPEEPDDPTTEDGYTIKPDTYAKTQTAGILFTLSAEVSYKVDEDTIIGVDADEIAWSVSSDDLTASDYSLSPKKYDSDSYKASADVTISKTGKATIKLSFTKPDGKQMTHDFEVTVEEDKGSDEKPYRVRLDVTPKDAGSIAFKNANSAYFGETDTVTVVVTPKDETKYSLNRVTVYKLQGDTDVYADNGTNVDPATGETNTYTFNMPASNVKVIAVFEEVPAAVHTLTVNTTGYENAKFTVTGGTRNDDGTYTVAKDADVTLTVTRPINFKLNVTSDDLQIPEPVVKDRVYTYTFKMPASDVTITAGFEKISGDTVTVKWTGKADGVDNMVNGQLLVTGTMEEKWYVFKLTMPDDSGPVSVYTTVKADDKGEISIPCAPGYQLDLRETDGLSNAEYNSGWKIVKSEPTEKLDKSETRPPKKTDKSNSDNVQVLMSTERENDAASESYRVQWTTAENMVKGRVIVRNTTAGEWYVFKMTMPDDSGPVSAYIAIEADDTGKIEIPCAPGYKLDLRKTTGITNKEYNGGEKIVKGDVTNEHLKVPFVGEE